jgi:hypothetical protein
LTLQIKTIGGEGGQTNHTRRYQDMKIRLTNLIPLAVIVVLLWLEVIEPRIDRNPVITTGPTAQTSTIVELQPTQPAPVYEIQVIELPTIQPTEASRAGWQAPTLQTGNTGSHNPGRTDHRNP